MARRARLIPPLSLIALFAALLLASALHSTARAGAIIFQPTRFDDPPPSGCQIDDCSLREAIIAANQNPGQDVILLDDGTYHLTIPGADEDAAQTGDLDITDDLVLTGVSFESTTVEAGATDRVFEVTDSATVRMGWLTVGNGSTTNRGGGILSVGDLTLLFARIRGNDAAAGGGGIYAVGNLRVYYSWIIGNTTSGADPGLAGRGAGLFLDEGQGSSVFITNSAITGNVAQGFLGGLHSQGDGNVVLTNVTISGNTGYVYAALDETNGTMTLNGVTIADNVSSGGGGFALYTAGTVVMTNTILEHQFESCGIEAGDGQVLSQGHNIAGDDTCELTGAGDLQNTSALLQPLGVNGGLTPTQALAAGSPARDAGDAASCADTDQRGRLRMPAACDIGAFEADATLPPNPIQGDVTCDGTANAVDALGILRAVSALSVAQQEPCVDPGQPFWFGSTQGNVNCDYAVNAVDALGILRYVAGLPVSQNEPLGPCPDIGTHLIPD